MKKWIQLLVGFSVHFFSQSVFATTYDCSGIPQNRQDPVKFSVEIDKINRQFRVEIPSINQFGEGPYVMRGKLDSNFRKYEVLMWDLTANFYELENGSFSAGVTLGGLDIESTTNCAVRD